MPHTIAITTVTPPASFTRENRAEVALDIRRALDDGHVVVDLATCQYMDSSALGCLVTVKRLAREANRRLFLVGLNDDLRTLFELTKLDHLFDTAPTLEAARSRISA